MIKKKKEKKRKLKKKKKLLISYNAIVKLNIAMIRQ